MKLSIYGRSLLYAVLLNVSFLLLLKLFFPHLSLFYSSKILFFELVAIILTYTTFILLYKKAYQAIAKDAFQKSKAKYLATTHQATRDKDLQLSLFKDREKYRREFLGNVSHELKTPLFTIQGYILTLIDGAVKDKKIRSNYLKRINKSVDRLIYIVRDLDVLAEIESGNLTLDFKPIDIVKLTQEVFEFLEIKAQESNVTLLLDSQLKSHQKVIADRERLEQVMINLISNAIAYSSKTAAEVQVSLQVQRKQVVIRVKDNGMGISAEHLPRVFERFYRIDAARSRESGGSGLGLAIVKNILEAHHSSISIESTLNKGSTFEFALNLHTDEINP